MPSSTRLRFCKSALRETSTKPTTVMTTGTSKSGIANSPILRAVLRRSAERQESTARKLAMTKMNTPNMIRYWCSGVRLKMLGAMPRACDEKPR